MVEPQVVLAAFAVLAHAVGGLADAEGAGAAAAVRQVDVEPVVHGIDDGLGFRFRHDELLSLGVGAKGAVRFPVYVQGTPYGALAARFVFAAGARCAMLAQVAQLLLDGQAVGARQVHLDGALDAGAHEVRGLLHRLVQRYAVDRVGDEDGGEHVAGAGALPA